MTLTMLISGGQSAYGSAVQASNYSFSSIRLQRRQYCSNSEVLASICVKYNEPEPELISGYASTGVLIKNMSPRNVASVLGQQFVFGQRPTLGGEDAFQMKKHR